MEVVKTFNDSDGPQWRHSLFGNPNDPETFRSFSTLIMFRHQSSKKIFLIFLVGIVGQQLGNYVWLLMLLGHHLCIIYKEGENTASLNIF